MSSSSTGITVTGVSAGVSGSTASGQTPVSYGTTATPGITISGQTPVSYGTTGVTSFTTTKRCEEMQAVDETVSTRIVVNPDVVSETEKVYFQVTSEGGVSFPADVLTPTIVVNFDESTEIQSVTIPRDLSQNANVKQFEVNLYARNGNLINDKPLLSSTSPKEDQHNPASVDTTKLSSNTLITRVDITILSTTDGNSPTSVVLDIKACTKPKTGNHCKKNLFPKTFN